MIAAYGPGADRYPTQLAALFFRSPSSDQVTYLGRADKGLTEDDDFIEQDLEASHAYINNTSSPDPPKISAMPYTGTALLFWIAASSRLDDDYGKSAEFSFSGMQYPTNFYPMATSNANFRDYAILPGRALIPSGGLLNQGILRRHSRATREGRIYNAGTATYGYPYGSIIRPVLTAFAIQGQPTFVGVTHSYIAGHRSYSHPAINTINLPNGSQPNDFAVIFIIEDDTFADYPTISSPPFGRQYRRSAGMRSRRGYFSEFFYNALYPDFAYRGFEPPIGTRPFRAREFGDKKHVWGLSIRVTAEDVERGHIPFFRVPSARMMP